MRIVYMPHRGGLFESLEDSRVFFDIKDMLEYIVSQWENAFSIRDIYISHYSYDSRIKAEQYVVCIGRCLGENYLKKYNSPQAIGFCSFGTTKTSLIRNAKQYFKEN
jgi:hypothetical protein